MQFLERFQNAQRAMGRLFEIVECVCLEGVALRDYAARLKINPSSASGRLYAALQSLQDHYDILDEPEKQRATINTGQYNGPASPPASRQWAAD